MRLRLFVLTTAIVLMLTACGWSSTASRVPASLHVVAAQVTVTSIPYAPHFPLKQLTRFMVKLTSTAGPG
jgi:outer membrane lipopolysaccharide assembly protein LptE/RlpB